ncbi:hypothetical protein Pcinc_035188 [Petrolisthes cinctipes]|uniref:Uncharacterized protein n=1 Tax=Petrolisthes cinctipes TaxID=88211 RepID=A0AAE1EPI6_PETCI|nr:hypothetical protein Pcinc_035188 [Petrolisthes cinctipes]
MVALAAGVSRDDASDSHLVIGSDDLVRQLSANQVQGWDGAVWCEMKDKLLHVEVIVGELVLVPPSSRHAQLTNSDSSFRPILPVVAVQVCNGPVLHVPFCDEGVQDRGRDEHISLPQEVLKTYSEVEGRFVFQRGKSCLFTFPDRDITSWDGKVNIVILDKFRVPASVYGRCEARLKEHNGLKGTQTLIGKLAVLNDKEERVSHLTIFVSCQDVGEDVSLQIQPQSEKDKTEAICQTELGNVHCPESIASQIPGLHTICNNECNDCKCKRNVTPTAGNAIEVNAVNADKHVKQNLCPINIGSVPINEERYFQELEIYPSSCSKIMDVDHITSEQIALMIEKIYNSKDETSKDTGVESPLIRSDLDDESYQNYPVIGIKKNPRRERIGNETVQKLGGDLETLSNTPKERPRRRPNSATSSSSNSLESSTVHDNAKGKLRNRTTLSPRSEISNGSSILSSSKSSRESSSNVSIIRRPTGWLRSTPVAPTPNTITHPKLNRTHFLRRVSTDTQLAYQLQTEVNRQVKGRLKQLDEGFKTQLEKLQKVKFRKGQTQKGQSVGCQTIDLFQGSYLSPELVEKISINSNYHEVQIHHDWEKSEVRNNEMLSSSNRIKPKIFQKNLTFDIDTSEKEEDNHTRRKYEADIDVPVQLHLGNATDRQMDNQNISGNKMTDIAATEANAACSTTSLERMSATSSDSKQKSHQDVANKSQDVTLNMMREPSQDTAQTYTIHGNLSKTIQSSEEVASEDYSKHSEYLIALSSNKTSTDSSHSHHRSVENNKGSQSSELAKASKMSLEVCKEILKGKQADSLTRAGNLLIKPQEYSSTPEEVVSVDASYQSCSVGSIKAEEVEEGNSISEIFSLPSGKNSIPNVNGDYSGYGSSILSSYSQPKDSIPTISNNSISTPQPLGNNIISTNSQSFTSESIGLLKSVKPISFASEIYSRPTAHVSESSINSKSIDTNLTSRADRDGQTMNQLKQKNEREGKNLGKDEGNIDYSVSDISGRIAALLVPRRLSVARINTDSVSSYIPSDLCNTMSSLSDMSQD